MSIRVSSRREDERYRLPSAVGAQIEFDGPDGARYALPLIEISARGASFALPGPVPGIKSGAILTDAVISMGQMKVNGNLSVARVTNVIGTGHICGVQFHPRSVEDRNDMVSLIARLQDLVGAGVTLC